MFPIVPVATFVATAATSVSVNKVLKEVITNNMPEAVTHLDTIQVKIASAALSMVIAGAAATHVETGVRKVTTKVHEIRAEKKVTTD